MRKQPYIIEKRCSLCSFLLIVVFIKLKSVEKGKILLECVVSTSTVKSTLKGVLLLRESWSVILQIEKALINDWSLVSKVSRKFHIPTIYNFAVIYLWKLLFFLKVANFLIVSIVFYIYKQNVTAELLKARIVMNAKIFEFVICVEEVINLLLFNLHDVPLIPYQTL